MYGVCVVYDMQTNTQQLAQMVTFKMKKKNYEAQMKWVHALL